MRLDLTLMVRLAVAPGTFCPIATDIARDICGYMVEFEASRVSLMLGSPRFKNDVIFSFIFR